MPLRGASNGVGQQLGIENFRFRTNNDGPVCDLCDGQYKVGKITRGVGCSDTVYRPRRILAAGVLRQAMSTHQDFEYADLDGCKPNWPVARPGTHERDPTCGTLAMEELDRASKRSYRRSRPTSGRPYWTDKQRRCVVDNAMLRRASAAPTLPVAGALSRVRADASTGHQWQLSALRYPGQEPGYDLDQMSMAAGEYGRTQLCESGARRHRASLFHRGV